MGSARSVSSIEGLQSWLDASPTPVHVVQTGKTVLEQKGFSEQRSFADPLHKAGFIARDGMLMAWRLSDNSAPLRIVGAHTDSPNLRIQPQPDITRAGWSQLGIEIYGGVLLNSWLDRDLGIAGRVIADDGTEHLFHVADAIARLPQLAIHLDRDINDKGLLLDRFAHTSPVWGTNAPGFTEWLSSVTGVSNIASFDAQLFDITSSRVIGVDRSLFASSRLDNQLSCWAAIEALASGATQFHQVVVLNDHEEVGSTSTTGAAGPVLEQFLQTLMQQEGVSIGRHHDRLAQSWCLSADNAHAVHPNYMERHDPRHGPIPNHGIALKLNGNQRYATSPRGVAHIRGVAQRASVELQTFVSRNNMPCGSTIGPITATRLGIEAIDVGVPQLSMHSTREMCGFEDALDLPVLMTQFFQN